jgi:tRNA dimethylallyltransferase
MNKVIVIVGPTAVGKTKVAIKLAQKVNGEIISADSMQIYKYLDIGTAKPTTEEMEGIKHYMIDIVEPDQEYSVAMYKEMALKCIDNVIKNNKIPIIVGGTGLYIKTVVENIEFSETISDWEYRKELSDKAEKEGDEFLHKKLEDIDPEAAAKIHKNDLKRIIRALEVFKYTGKPISYHQQISKQNPSKYEFIMFGLTMNREKLYRRIDQRVNNMIEGGLIQEVKKLIDIGISDKSIAMQGLGYKEMLEYFSGTKTIDEVTDIIKRDSRRYAKRQLTWFRRNASINWIDIEEDEKDDALKKIINYLEANQMFM